MQEECFQEVTKKYKGAYQIVQARVMTARFKALWSQAAEMSHHRIRMQPVNFRPTPTSEPPTDFGRPREEGPDGPMQACQKCHIKKLTSFLFQF